MKMTIRARYCTYALALAASLCCAAEAPGFKVTKTYPVPGNGGFDYIVFDAPSNRLYVSHGTEVNVVDADSGKLLGTVHDTPGVHGISIVPDLHRGFTTNGGNATVSVFDTQSFKTLKNISVAADPDFTFYDAALHRVLVCHGDSAQITEIDPDREEVSGKIPLGGGAEAAVVDSKGRGFVNLEEESTVVVFDPAQLKVTSRWPITGCKTPTGLAMDKTNSRLFIGCRSKVLAVMDANNGKVIATLPIGDRVDAVAFDSGKQLVFASNGDGTISVIKQNDPDHYTSVGQIPTQPSAKTMAHDPKTGRLFLSAAEMETAPSGERRRSRPKAGSFRILVVEAQ
jgi:DNA-binding beta-propeller fold protein YncE